MYERYKSVISEATALREVYGPNAAKKIARDFGVAVITAKLWLSGRFPMARREDLAAKIRTELNRRDALSAEIRRQWCDGGDGEEDRAVDRGRIIARRGSTD